ncbi:hypothetical protein GCM10028820_31590 [Tessaracoccus terricola]
MITGLQLAIISGALIAGGAALLVHRLVPAQPHLGDALARLRPQIPAIHDQQPAPAPDLETRLGAWVQQHLPIPQWGAPANADLAMVDRTKAAHYGAKVLTSLIGLVIGPLLTILAALLGLELPFAIPVLGSIGLAIAMWFLPDAELKDKAVRARAEFSHALGAFIEMVALDRLSGSGVPQALHAAAKIGDSWPFQRLEATLKRTEYTGQNPWDALDELGKQLKLPELTDLADIMRLGGADGTQIYDSLRARGENMRNTLLNTHITAANQAGARIAIPVGLLVLVLALTTITPAFLRMLT